MPKSVKKKAKPKAKVKPKKKPAAKKAQGNFSRPSKAGAKLPAKASKSFGPKIKKSKEKLLGKVDHYFDKINVAAMKLGDSLRVGDTVRIEGGAVAFTQPIASIQIEHEAVQAAKKGDEVGFKVKQKVREGYRVFRV